MKISGEFLGDVQRYRIMIYQTFFGYNYLI